RLAPEAFDSNLAGVRNWYYRRYISRGVLKALLERGDRDGAQRFAAAIAADRDLDPPFNEGGRVDALARLFDVADHPTRELVLTAASSLRGARDRGVLLANLSRTLAGEGKPQATTLAGSALDAIRAIADTVRRDSALQEIVRLLAP